MLERDDRQLSATQTLDQALVDADHLAILNAIWTAETASARDQRYAALLAEALPQGYRLEPGHRVKWLWRTLRAAELAGLDTRLVLADAIAVRDLTGACDIPAVIDARIRRSTAALVPQPAGPWSARVPEITDPERKAFITKIAAMMDSRKERIGQHAAEHAAPWAVSTLGRVPDDPAARLEWQQRASAIGAWRELSGYDHPADPIGPEPATGTPDLRAAWHEALTATGAADGPDVRGMPDGMLAHLRDTYPIETAWAPQHVGDELRHVRAGARDAHLAAIRARAEAASHCGQPGQAERQQALAASYQAMHDAYRQRETVFAAVMADRAAWEQATRQQRHLAIAADAELRRRHPTQPHPPLRSTEPQPANQPQRDELILSVGNDIPQIGQWIKDLAAQHRAFAEKLAERQNLTMLTENHDREDPGLAFPAWKNADRDAILQPPKPQIQPSVQMLERATGRDLDMEAAE